MVVAEYGATIAGRKMAEEKSAKKNRTLLQRQAVNTAMAGLAPAEEIVTLYILASLDSGCSGTIILSKIAQESNVSVSVANKALAKLASAGVVETRALGRKGVYVRIINPLLTS